MEERYSVATPENVIFRYDVAGIGSRFIAALVDFLIYLVVDIALAFIISVLTRYVRDEYLRDIITAAYVGATFLFYWGYYILFEMIWAGQSPGKRVARIRVVRLDGTPASPGQIFIRNIGRLVDLFPGFYAVGIITMMLNDQSRRLGDFAAGTFVVREITRINLAPTRAETEIAVRDNQPATVNSPAHPLYRLNSDTIQIVNNYIDRRSEMASVLRARLAMQIAVAVAKKLDVPAPTQHDEAETLLDSIHQASKQIQ